MYILSFFFFYCDIYTDKTTWFAQMDPRVLPFILLVISAVHAFQYTELVQHIDSHQEEYVEVQYLVS